MFIWITPLGAAIEVEAKVTGKNNRRAAVEELQLTHECVIPARRASGGAHSARPGRFPLRELQPAIDVSVSGCYFRLTGDLGPVFDHFKWNLGTW